MRRLAIYPGSFDPLTLGHADVIERAASLFDTLVVAVGRNSSKSPLLTVESRIEGIQRSCQHLPNVHVESFDGLLVEYARKKKATAIVRGLRATADFEFEFQMATVNRKLGENLETVFFMTKWEHSYLSSTIVKEIARLRGNYRELVPPPLIPIIENTLESSG